MPIALLVHDIHSTPRLQKSPASHLHNLLTKYCGHGSFHLFNSHVVVFLAYPLTTSLKQMS